MTRELLIVRHAKSSWEEGGRSDFERTLNQRGVDDGTRMATIYAERLPRPDRILCSPARRTRDTLAFLIPGLVDPRRVDYEDSLYLADAHTLLAWVRAAPESTRVLMLVGHNPGLTDLVNLLRDGTAPSLDNLPTLGAVHFRSSAAWSAWGEAEAEEAALLKPKAFPPDARGSA